jgi:hypothetical protein
MEEEYFPLLTIGIHILTESELEKLCVEGFTESINRPEIFRGLQVIVEKLKTTGVCGYLWINGSFVTEKPEPNDADLLLVLTRDQYNQSSEETKAAISWFIGEETIGLRCDTYTLIHEPVTDWEGIKSQKQWRDHWNYCHWIRQFGYSRNKSPKGIASLKLN